VFWAEIFAILACAKDRNEIYEGANLYCSDSQAAFQALDASWIMSELASFAPCPFGTS
jgi:hypothetical protein